MKNIITLCCLLLLWYTQAAAQWTWIRGSNTRNLNGVYGVKGEPSFLNDPGSRFASVTWTDPEGDLWLFGGDGYSTLSSTGLLNDLWKYDRAANTWTWMGGDHIRDQHGIYGIKGTASPTNKPGARRAAISWADASGKLWMFGGFGYAAAGPSGSLNDLWSYDRSTNMWTWVSGDHIINEHGIYGTQGIPQAINKPGARSGATAWKDPAGKLWLFGGNGQPESGAQGKLNDIWKYDPNNNQWTWIKGSKFRDLNGVYGSMGIPAMENTPGSREESISWMDANGALWLFGGMACRNPVHKDT